MKNRRSSLLVNVSIILVVLILGFAMTGAYDPACSGTTEGVFTSSASAGFVCGHQTPTQVVVELRLDTLQQLYSVYGSNYSTAAIVISSPVSGVSIGATSRTDEGDASNILGPLNKTYTLSAYLTFASGMAAGTYTIPLSFTIHNKETGADFTVTQSFSLTLTKDDQSAPAAPTVASVTSDTVTLDVIAGAEYSLDGSTWQDSNVFSGLSVNTSYTFYARLKETDTLNASPSSPGTVQKTNKLDQAAPAAPTVQSVTADTIILDPIAGAQYRIKGSPWQDSNIFTGLSPNTNYVFQARMKATPTYYASPASGETAQRTNKLDQPAPAAPTVQSVTSDTVTLDVIPGARYRIQGSPWQDSNVFTGLSPVTTYVFQARLIATPVYYASPASAGTPVTTDKADQTAPAAPTVASVTSDTVTLDVIAGAEYSLDGVTWQDSNAFTGLSPATDYTFYARLKETSTQYASPASDGTDETTDKEDQVAPAAPAVASKTTDSVTITPVAGAEYSLDGIIWQDSNVFTGLTSGTEYTFYIRLKETDTQYASPASTGTAATTDALVIEDIEDDDTPLGSTPGTGDSSAPFMQLALLAVASAALIVSGKKAFGKR